MDIIIRKAEIDDLPKIIKIDRFGDILKRCSPLDQLDSKTQTKKSDGKYFKNFIHGRNKWLYVAEINGKIVGFFLFNILKREHYWRVKKVGYLDLMYIEKKYRNKGIAKKFFEVAYDIFRKKGMKYIKLSVQTDNKKAHEIWKRLGYKDFRADMYKKL